MRQALEPRAPSPPDAGHGTPVEAQEPNAPASPAARAVAGWLQQLARTVKTCRLYDAANPTVALFRRDLAAALDAVLKDHGAIEIGFTPEEIFLGTTPLYAARSRDDNLSLPFFRDGIRAMSFRPDIPAREVDALLDAILHVTRLGSEDADLVTLLWESELDHIAVQYVSTEGDVESGADGPLDAGEVAPGSVAPWPRTAPPAGGGTVLEGLPANAGDGMLDDTGRSDDRVTAGRAREVEAALLGLEIAADAEIDRLLREFDTERAEPLARAALRLMGACFARATRESDRVELRQFLPRLLHDSVGKGDWREARECLYLLRDPSGERDPVAAFARDIARPESLTSRNAWNCLDGQPAQQQEQFFEFARELGPEATDWLMRGIAESPRQGLRRGLARALAGMVADNPERLAPWLADERWYVVRNVVHILGQMDTAAPIGLLRSAASHPEFRVRREVVTALARAPRDQARPVLMEMLKTADSRLYGTLLHHLATELDPELATMLLEQIEDDAFTSRPEAERRAVYQALAVVGGDQAVPVLEAHVLQGNWFSRGNEASRMAAVMCLARIATPAAQAILERGAKSRRAEVVRACEAGLAALRPRA